jgi:hypothetical protein
MSSRMRKACSDGAPAIAIGSRTTVPVHRGDRVPYAVVEGSQRNGLGPIHAALVKASALTADVCLPHAPILEAT